VVRSRTDGRRQKDDSGLSAAAIEYRAHPVLRGGVRYTTAQHMRTADDKIVLCDRCCSCDVLPKWIDDNDNSVSCCSFYVHR